jgi:hypothetical protein
MIDKTGEFRASTAIGITVVVLTALPVALIAFVNTRSYDRISHPRSLDAILVGVFLFIVAAGNYPRAITLINRDCVGPRSNMDV